MAWIRLDDDYIYHPKFTLLSDRAFRLWHEGACYCRKLMTDGLIARSDLKAFKYASPKTIRELTTPRGQSSSPWVEDQAGYRVHDYLDWNPSQAEEQRDREAWNGGVRPITGVDLIAEERIRQMTLEGWTPQHDDQHWEGTMTAAACCYATLAWRQVDGTIRISVDGMPPPSGWPWEAEWWKPNDDPVRNLAKAGALIAAELDRLQRRAPNDGSTP